VTALLGIDLQLRGQVRPGGHQSRLAKLGVAHQQQTVFKLDISDRQGQRFTDAYPRAHEHQQQAPKCRGLEGAQGGR
jgi:hypothetical protein